MATKNQLSDAAKSLDRVESHDGLELGQASSLPEEAHFDEKTAATIRHRIDLRLIPLLGAIYGISLMDRTNMPNAAIAGMLTDLKLSHGPRYNLVNMSFFITYILLQPVMVIIGRKVGPRTFLPSICLAWGAVIIGFGFAKNWPTLLPLRLLLGAMEAGYFPGCLYLLSCWYTRFEVARRYSSFYLIGSVSSALSGILAYGLQQLDGLANLSGWRWIFIMEGVITCAIASFAFIFLVKFPDKERVKPSWGFLSPDQLEFQIERLNAERRDVELEDLTWKRFFQPATEWYIYGFPFILFLINVTAYAFAFTLPIILRSKLGFNVAMAQCLVAPPYVLAGAIMYLVAWYSDHKKTRGPVLCCLATVSLIGLAIMGFVEHPWVQYFGVFVAVVGTSSAAPAIMTYQANNIRGQWRRAFCSALLTGIGAVGGIVGSLIFRTQDAPTFVPGFATCIVCNVLIIVTVGILTLYFRKKNGQADRGECILLEEPNFRFTI